MFIFLELIKIKLLMVPENSLSHEQTPERIIFNFLDIIPNPYSHVEVPRVNYSLTRSLMFDCKLL